MAALVGLPLTYRSNAPVAFYASPPQPAPPVYLGPSPQPYVPPVLTVNPPTGSATSDTGDDGGSWVPIALVAGGLLVFLSMRKEKRRR